MTHYAPPNRGGKMALARNGQSKIAECEFKARWPGRAFSALELLCIMYAGFKRIEPGMDIGVDLGEEWEMAESLREEMGAETNH